MEVINNEYYCFRVEVKTTNYLKNTYVKHTNPTMQVYGTCENGIIYIIARSFEEAVKKAGESIIKIEKIGIGLDW